MPLWSSLERGTKRAAVMWHRRAGKDDVCLHWAAVSMLQRVGSYWHMLPEASQARKAIWDAINPRTGKRRIDEAFPMELRESTRSQDMFIRFKNGATWQVVGSDNYDSLVGSPPIGVVFSEYALADPQAWAMLRPILAENGGWALFISTPRGRNHHAKLVDMALSDPDWFGQVLTVEDTNAISLDVVNRERRELTAERGEVEAEAIIRQEYYCSTDAAIPGAYYSALIEQATKAGRITDVSHRPEIPTQTAWDLGIGDSTAIWWYQRVGSELHIIDYYESSGVGIEHYAKKISEKPYLYGDAILPHDAGHAQLANEGKSLADLLRGMGIKNRVLGRNDIESGIQAARNTIPICWFDKVKCARGIEALRHYHKEWDEKLKTFKDRPKHDWSSHAADAWRYLATDVSMYVQPKKQSGSRFHGSMASGGWMR